MKRAFLYLLVCAFFFGFLFPCSRSAAQDLTHQLLTRSVSGQVTGVDRARRLIVLRLSGVPSSQEATFFVPEKAPVFSAQDVWRFERVEEELFLRIEYFVDLDGKNTVMMIEIIE